MALLLDSFWRAVAYCVRPRVIALSFLPLLIMVGVGLDTVKQIDSQLHQRNYEGFLK